MVQRVNRRVFLDLSLLAAVVTHGTRVLAQSKSSSVPDSPWFGTWLWDASRSSSGASPQRYKRITLKIEPWKDGLRVIYDMVGTRGVVNHIEWSGRFDGKDYPVQGVDYVLTNAYSLRNDHAFAITVKVDGNPAATADVTISGDGGTLTSVTSERDPQGKEVQSTSVYVKKR